MMWTSGWRVLVHILGIAEVSLSKAPTPNTAHWALCHVWLPLRSSPLHCMCVFVCAPVCNVSGKKKEFPNLGLK